MAGESENDFKKRRKDEDLVKKRKVEMSKIENFPKLKIKTRPQDQDPRIKSLEAILENLVGLLVD